MTLLEQISTAVENGRFKQVEHLVKQCLAEKTDPNLILEEGLVKPMRTIGQRLKDSDVYIAKILVSARSMRRGLDVLTPYLEEGRLSFRGKVILGTAEGDLHDLGKNLVGIMFHSAGFEVVDLGIDVSAGAFVKAVRDHPEAKIVCISSLLTTSLPEMKHIVSSINQMEERHRIKVMVGGGPVTQAFANDIGADAYTSNAFDAAEVAKKFIT